MNKHHLNMTERNGDGEDESASYGVPYNVSIYPHPDPYDAQQHAMMMMKRYNDEMMACQRLHTKSEIYDCYHN
jgi:hypothetical protein